MLSDLPLSFCFPISGLHCLVATHRVPLSQWKGAAPIYYTSQDAGGFTYISTFDPHIPISIQLLSPFTDEETET